MPAPPYNRSMGKTNVDDDISLAANGINIAGNAIENGLFQLTKVALSSITALLGTVQIAANGVAQSFWSVAALMGTALGLAFVTVIGQCMGAGDTEAAEYYMRKLLRITFFASVLWNGLILLAAPFVLRAMRFPMKRWIWVVILVIIHNIFNALFYPLSGALANGLRAAGDVKYTMYVSVFSTIGWQSRIFDSVRHFA